MSKRSLGLCVIAVAAFVLLAPALNGQVVPASPQNLTCSPAPCILTPVQVDNAAIGAEAYGMAANPNNPNQLVITGPDGNCSTFGFYYTADGGSSWSHSCKAPVAYPGQQVVGYDLNNTVYGGGTSEDVVLYLAFSKDNGATWSNLKAVDVQPNFGIIWPRMAVDTTTTSPFANRLYISSVHGGVFGGSTRLHVSFSGDGGQHWAGRYLDRKQFPNGDAFPYLSVGVDGELYMTWFYCKAQYDYGPCNRRGNPILLSKSSDGGSTWSTPVVIAKIDLPPDKCLYGCLPNTHLLGLAITPVSAVVGSGSTAQVSVVFLTWTRTQLQVGVVTSEDGGATFGPPVRVTHSNFGDQFLPWISAAKDGTLAVSWLDRRNDPANFKYEPFFATSKDGMDFVASQPLSSAMSDPSYYPLLGPAVWTGRKFLTSWGDYSTGVVHIDLGGAQF